jgi:hypothetical protein
MGNADGPSPAQVKSQAKKKSRVFVREGIASEGRGKAVFNGEISPLRRSFPLRTSECISFAPADIGAYRHYGGCKCSRGVAMERRRQVCLLPRVCECKVRTVLSFPPRCNLNPLVSRLETAVVTGEKVNVTVNDTKYSIDTKSMQQVCFR